MPALRCTCVLNEKVPLPGHPGFYTYHFRCTWNQGDTNRYNRSVVGNDEEQAQVKAETDCPYEPRPRKGDD